MKSSVAVAMIVCGTILIAMPYIHNMIAMQQVAAAFAEEERSDLIATVTGNNTFALDLYSILRKEEGNLFFSPYSLSSALAMTYAGARGDTAAEIAKVLHFTQGSDGMHPALADLNKVFDTIQKAGHVRLHIANSLWPQKDHPFQPDYLTLLKEHYGASITPVDYVTATEQAREKINKWVEVKTKEKITNLIPPGVLNHLTRLVLVNAIYFKGDWKSQFDPINTRESEFTVSKHDEVKVSMMHQKGRFGYGETSGAQLLELPYLGSDLSMVVILPQTVDHLPEIERQLTEANLHLWLSSLSKQEVLVWLPKFKVTWGVFSLKEPLQYLGMRKAFDPLGADFSGMDGTRELFITQVLHKAFVEVNEEGTEAAAATAAVVGRTMALHRTQTFKADHPFLFLIRDNVTGSILFLGRVLNPSKN